MNESALEGWSEADQAAGFTLPAPYYYEPAAFALERERIFMKSWHLAGHFSEFALAGAYVTVDIFEQSVIVIGGKDGVVRAFHNVCRHRGNRLVADRRGRVPRLTCGYHAWTYGHDGNLLAAPLSQHVAGFCRDDFGLRAVRVEVFAGFVFVTLDPSAEPIATMAAGAETEIRHYIPDLDQLTLLEASELTVDANWKVIHENAIEGYHFDFTGTAHRHLAALVSDYRLTAHGRWWTYIGPPRAATTSAYGVPIAGARWQTDSFFNIGLWPNTSLYVFPYADVVGLFVMMPTGPETSSLRLAYYSVKGREVSELSRACIRWMNEDLGQEDIRLNVSTQRGLRSQGYGRGRFMIGDEFASRSEHLVRHFQQLCYGAIRSSTPPASPR